MSPRGRKPLRAPASLPERYQPTNEVRRARTSPSIRAVTFDVGGTLIQVWPSVGHVYADVAVACEMPTDPG